MRRNLVTALVIGLLIISHREQVTAGPREDIGGAWILIEQFKDETHAHRMSLQVTGNKITGMSGSSKIEGDISGETITLKWLTSDGRVDATYTGRMQGDVIKGDGDWGGLKLQWSARRPSMPPAAGPRTHTFTPTEFHRVFSWNIPAALRIFPGDTVKTKSVDAGGDG
jgi:amidase